MAKNQQASIWNLVLVQDCRQNKDKMTFIAYLNHVMQDSLQVSQGRCAPQHPLSTEEHTWRHFPYIYVKTSDIPCSSEQAK